MQVRDEDGDGLLVWFSRWMRREGGKVVISSFFFGVLMMRTGLG